jgi:hypothetical protein
VHFDRLAPLLWTLGSMQESDALRRTLAGLAAKASCPGKASALEYDPARGVRFSPR